MRETRIIGYGFAVRRATVQKVGQDGQPIYSRRGDPEMTEITELIFTSPPGPDPEALIVPFSEESRSKLVELLTGGVLVPRIEVAGASAA